MILAMQGATSSPSGMGTSSSLSKVKWSKLNFIIVPPAMSLKEKNTVGLMDNTNQ